MAKNVSIANDVYVALRKRKMENESFSDLLRRLLEVRPAITEVVGKGLLTEEDWRVARRHLAEMQKTSFERIEDEAS